MKLSSHTLLFCFIVCFFFHDLCDEVPERISLISFALTAVTLMSYYWYDV